MRRLDVRQADLDNTETKFILRNGRKYKRFLLVTANAAPFLTALTDKHPYAKKSFGQNFLIDGNFISKIVDAVELTAADTLIEIGPGRGALTEPLLERCGRLIAIELDKELVPFLRTEFGENDRFELISADVLRIDFSTISFRESKMKLVANLPYYISTAVLLHLLNYRDQFSTMVLMFQREVVDRMTAPPGRSERGFLTVMIEAFFSIEKLFDVPPNAFQPVPKVWSAVVRLRPRPDVGSLAGREPEFETLVGAAFRQKRKTILNNLKSASKELNIDDPSRLLATADIDSKRRAETLTIDEWKNLFLSWI